MSRGPSCPASPVPPRAGVSPVATWVQPPAPRRAWLLCTDSVETAAGADGDIKAMLPLAHMAKAAPVLPQNCMSIQLCASAASTCKRGGRSGAKPTIVQASLGDPDHKARVGGPTERQSQSQHGAGHQKAPHSHPGCLTVPCCCLALSAHSAFISTPKGEPRTKQDADPLLQPTRGIPSAWCFLLGRCPAPKAVGKVGEDQELTAPAPCQGHAAPPHSSSRPGTDEPLALALCCWLSLWGTCLLFALPGCFALRPAKAAPVLPCGAPAVP